MGRIAGLEAGAGLGGAKLAAGLRTQVDRPPEARPDHRRGSSRSAGFTPPGRGEGRARAMCRRNDPREAARGLLGGISVVSVLRSGRNRQLPEETP